MQTHDENHKQQNKTLVKTNCCASKNTINTVKRQLMEWEEVCANHVSNKGLASKNKQKKELLQLNTKRTNNLVKKWQGCEQMFLLRYPNGMTQGTQTGAL